MDGNARKKSRARRRTRHTPRMTVGVALAAYNGMRFFEKQLDSLRGQSRLPDRVVIRDDGSDDGTVRFAEQYIRRHGLEDRFVVIQNEKNLGCFRNFYAAMDDCGTDLIFLSDQDDLWHEDKVERMARIMEERENLSLLCCAHSLINERDRPLRTIRYENFRGRGGLARVDAERIVRNYSYPGMCFAVRGAFWARARETAIKIDAPHDRVLSLLAQAEKGMYFYDYIGAYHRMHQNNVGDERNRARDYLRRDQKVRELSSMLDWLDEIWLHRTALSEDAVRVIDGYSSALRLRLEGMLVKSPLPVIRAAAQSRGDVPLKSLISDLWILAFGGNA